MELRRGNGNHLFFIQAIRSGVVERILNVDSRGRPSLVFKSLQDIYDSEDAKRRIGLSTHQEENRDEDVASDNDEEEVGRPYSCIVDRKTKKRDSDSDMSDQNSGDDGEGSDFDDLNFGKITLKQLKKQNKAKKRKILHSDNVTVKQEYDDLQTEEDETDLMETISSWKSKVSNKSKGKKKHLKRAAQVLDLVKPEQILSGGVHLQSGEVLPSPTVLKIEISETENSELMDITTEANDSPAVCAEQVVVCIETIEVVERETCALNKVCYDHVEDTEDVTIGCIETTFPQFMNPPDSDDSLSCIGISITEEVPSADQSSDLCSNFQADYPELQVFTQETESSGAQVPVMTNESTASELTYDTRESTSSNIEFVSFGCLSEIFNSSLVSNNYSNHEMVSVCCEDNLYSTQRESVVSVGADAEKDCNRDENPVVLLDGLTRTEEQLSQTPRPDDSESDSPDRTQHSIPMSDLSVPETGYNRPERLLSTRKAISPASQERLCQAMKGVELVEDGDHHKCKVKLQFKNLTENEPSTENLQCTENTEAGSCEGLGVAHRAKVTIRPKRTISKLKNPPNDSQKSHVPSRSLPNFSTGTRTLQSCSESAIAFSQRQMHDIESLATKLMEELNHMKDIVEGKLQCEASPLETLTYDVGQAKKAIKSARKAEETTKKWLSIMTRDCNRFCTIMKFSDKAGVASPNTVQKERRKITFADEAGGVLCHVKVFEDDMASPDSQR